MAQNHSVPVAGEIELEITNVAHGGVFVARHEGRVIFVSDTLPGEVVRARVTDDRHASFWRAETLEVIQASPDRQPHVWSAASVDRPPESRAGGAEFGHIRLDRQRMLKKQVIEENLSRMAGVERTVVVAPTSSDIDGDGTGWRTRVRLQVDEDGFVGPYAARSHRVIRVADLPLATEAVAQSAPLDQRFRHAESIDVIGPNTSAPRVVVNDSRTRRGGRDGASSTIRERVGDREFRLDVQGFWQVHRAAAQTLTTAVGELIDPSLFDPLASNLDLYGGVGLLAAAVGDRFGESVRITTVESSASASAFATANLADWPGATAVTDRVERYVRRLVSTSTAHERSTRRGSTVVLDPPRSGAGRDVIRAISTLLPAQIVYVACDPVALARDVALLAGQGYELREIRAFDLFPHTHHVECVARLTR